MEDSGIIIVVLIIVGVCMLVGYAIVIDENKPKEKNSTTTQREITVENNPIYNSLDSLLNTDSGEIAGQILKYVRNKVVAGCEEIKRNSKNPMLCGVQIKEYIGTSRAMFKEDKALYALSGLSEGAYGKLIDGICMDIYTEYFGE